MDVYLGSARAPVEPLALQRAFPAWLLRPPRRDARRCGRLRTDAMSFVCDYCGKNRLKAHKVSHSNIKTRKWQQPNLQPVRAIFEGQVRHVRACTRCIRSGRVVKAA